MSNTAGQVIKCKGKQASTRLPSIVVSILGLSSDLVYVF